MADINGFFASLSTQITMQNKQLQEQILLTDQKMSNDFDSVVRAHDEFKQQVREELDDLRALSLEQKKYLNSSLPDPPIVTSSQDLSGSPSFTTVSKPPSTSLTLNCTHTSTLLGNLSSTTTPDVQTQMLLMLLESFSKLSSALREKSSDTKSDWPNFPGI